jgi:hypothetical protein
MTSASEKTVSLVTARKAPRRARLGTHARARADGRRPSARGDARAEFLSPRGPRGASGFRGRGHPRGGEKPGAKVPFA